MDLMLEAGLIKKHLFSNGVRYEKYVDFESHNHLICSSCGKVMECRDEAVKNAIESMRIKKFTMKGDYYELQAYYLKATNSKNQAYARGWSASCYL